jgi:hypothetical protein
VYLVYGKMVCRGGLVWYTAVLLTVIVVGGDDLPNCIGSSHHPRICERNDTHCGEWVGKWWQPSACSYRDITPVEARKCMKDKVLACIGDSMIRNFCLGVAFFLSGQTPELESNSNVDRRLENGTDWLNATKIENGYILPNTDNAKKHNWEWQVQIWELHSNSLIHNGRVENVLSNKMPGQLPNVGLRNIDFALWAHGINDYGWFDTPPYGEKFFEQMTGQWLRIREKMAVPSVWMSMNNNCKEIYTPDALYMGPWIDDEKKLRGFHMVEDSNYVVHKKLHDLGLPYFDAAAPLRSPQRCNVSFNGLHVKMWVDIVRAKILFNHLCDDDLNWVASPNRF